MNIDKMDIDKILRGEKPVPQDLLEKRFTDEEEYKKELENIKKQEIALVKEIKQRRESDVNLDESSPEMKEYAEKIKELVEKRIKIQERKPLSLIEKEKQEIEEE